MTAAPDLVEICERLINFDLPPVVYKDQRDEIVEVALALHARLTAPVEAPILQAEPSPDKMIADAIAGEPISMPIADIEMLLGLEESDSPIGNELISAQPVGPPSPPDPEVERLMELAREATPGPWTCERQDDDSGEIYHAIHSVHDYEWVANIHDKDANANFIAACSPEVIIGLCTKLLAKPAPVEDAEVEEVRKRHWIVRFAHEQGEVWGSLVVLHGKDAIDDRATLLRTLSDRDTKLAAVTQERDGMRARAETAELERDDARDDNMRLNQAFHERNAANARAETAERALAGAKLRTPVIKADRVNFGDEIQERKGMDDDED